MTRGPRFVPMSGTMRRKQLNDCSHLYAAALDRGSPVPTAYQTLEQWHNAIDVGVRDENRIDPGALWGFCMPEERALGIEGARAGFRRRLLDTPGVIATSEAVCDVPLVMQVRDVEVPANVRDAFALLREFNKLPNGDPFRGGLAAWQHARELACGFAYRYDPPPPPEWLAAQAAWNQFVADKMKLDALRLDSPLMVWNAVAAGKFGPVPEWEAWKNIGPSFVPNPVPLWISDYLVKDAEEWALKTGGIVWLGHSSAYTNAPGDPENPDVDEALGKMFKRIPYFGGGKKGDAIRNHKGPCAASIRSHGTGKNLVYWNKALLVSFPSSGNVLEQLLARHQREGQEADVVEFHFYMHSLETFDAYVKAREECEYAEQMNGSPQRILGATVLRADGHAFNTADFDDLLTSEDPLWSK